jgi:hypothetical protein
MQKQTRKVTAAERKRGRTSGGKKPPEVKVDLVELIGLVLEDTEHLLKETDVMALSSAVWLSPLSVRDVVDQLVRNAESSLAEGGLRRYIALRQISALLEKNVDWFARSPRERKEAALRTFAQGEQSCRRANKRIAWFSKRTSRLPENLRSVLADARMIFQQVVGRLDEVAWGEILDAADFGPGATREHSVETGTLAEKLDSGYKHSATARALPYFVAYGKRNPNWVSYLIWEGASYEVMRGDRVTTVPKKWDKDRTIGIQPSLNVFLQKGVGTYWSQRLLRIAGISLQDQRPNQHKAWRGSIDGNVVTIDLKNASGCMAYKAVEWFCPGDWFEVLDSLRCAEYQIGRKGEWHRYESFSSMGNGYTFPLETLLFYAVAKASVRFVGASAEYLGVFGDDITIPWDAALLCIEALAFLGFRTNVDKTKMLGNFRESCGVDYAQGVDVRPVYLDSKPVGPAAVYDLHNRLLIGSMVRLDKTCSYLRSLMPESGGIPADFGLALVEESGWFPGKSVRVFQGYIADPPDPSGWCTSQQSVYWTFPELVMKTKPLAPDRYHWYARYLSFLKGAPSEERDARAEVWYRREGFSFTWLTVPEVRGERLRRRCSDPRAEAGVPPGITRVEQWWEFERAARHARALATTRFPVRGS